MITKDMAVHEATLLDIDAASVFAVAEVESNNGGFLPDGRPVILLEALWFHHFTKGIYDETHPDISAPVWDRSLYKGGAAEYVRYNEAAALDEYAARMSTSWGTFQIMGFNFASCDFPDVNSFVTAMSKDVASHLLAFGDFVRHTPGLIDTLRSHDWDHFAALYNGPGAVSEYSAKIEAAFEQYSA